MKPTNMKGNTEKIKAPTQAATETANAYHIPSLPSYVFHLCVFYLIGYNTCCYMHA